MKMLILGGTAWLSRLIADQAHEQGHQVTCTARGTSGPAPEGVRFMQGDRDRGVPEEIVSADWDVIVDVATNPGHVRRALGALADAHWIFVSTVSVYADHAQPMGQPTTTPLMRADHRDGEPENGEMYGAMKVACEELIHRHARHSTILRPGLIVGPGDPTGRFTYWPSRLATAAEDGQPVLVPAPPTTPTQWIDGRDLASWTVQLAEAGTLGTFDAVGPAVSRETFISQLAAPHSPPPSPRWVSAAELEELDVRPWAGPRSIPFWVPWAGWEYLMDRDAEPAAQAGLRTRPLEVTAEQTRAWVETAPDAVTGISRAEELAVVQALDHSV